MGQALELADLVDLEWTLHRIRTKTLADDALTSRGLGVELAAEIGVSGDDPRGQITQSREHRIALCRAWLERVRAKLPELPGASIASGYLAAGWGLAALGLFLGMGSARTVLHYDGTRPINVFYFIGIFFFLQIALLLVLVLLMTLGKVRGSVPLGWVPRLIARLVNRKVVSKEVATGFHAFRARRTLYGPVERWLLFAMTQRFGVAFNTGAFLTVLYLVTFTDLAFSWSTTLDLEATQVHRMTEVLSTPWRWALPDAVPGDDVVAASRWDRLNKAYAASTLEAGRFQSQRWWSFLVAGLLTYGFFPRFFAWVIGMRRLKRSLAEVGLDHGEFQGLYEGLFPRATGWVTSRDAAPGQRELPERRVAHATPSPAGPAMLIAWGRLASSSEALAELARDALAWPIVQTGTAGGADLDADDATLLTLRRVSPSRAVLVVDTGVQPTREILDFLREVREALGAHKDLCVTMVVDNGSGGFTEPDRRDLESWELRLSEIGDAFLRVRGMGEAK